MDAGRFIERPHFRYDWWRKCRYVPDIYRALTSREQRIMADWFDATDIERGGGCGGEMGVPMGSVLLSVINGSNVRRIVQLGHCAGWSTLMIGFCLRSMGAKRALWSADIDPEVNAYCQRWVDHAELGEYLTLHLGNSTDATSPLAAAEYLGGPPALVIIDSSHQYAQTVKELDLWYSAMAPGGLMILHDTSIHAQQFDTTGAGGVHRAVTEWGQSRIAQRLFLNHDGVTPGYMDICGLGIIQKPSDGEST